MNTFLNLLDSACHAAEKEDHDALQSILQKAGLYRRLDGLKTLLTLWRLGPGIYTLDVISLAVHKIPDRSGDMVPEDAGLVGILDYLDKAGLVDVRWKERPFGVREKNKVSIRTEPLARAWGLGNVAFLDALLTALDAATFNELESMTRLLEDMRALPLWHLMVMLTLVRLGSGLYTVEKIYEGAAPHDGSERRPVASEGRRRLLPPGGVEEDRPDPRRLRPPE